MKEYDRDNEKLDEIILQTRNEIKQDRERMKLDKERMKQDREKMRLENEKLDEIILQTKNEIKQIEKENDRLHELESKIDGLFLKYDINSPLAQKPEP